MSKENSLFSSQSCNTCRWLPSVSNILNFPDKITPCNNHWLFTIPLESVASPDEAS